MALKKPGSAEECVYFTNRTIGDGRAMAWVFRKECPKCKGIMGKPQKKNGKLKWYAIQGIFYVYKFDKDKLLSSSPKNNAPAFPEYIIKE